MDDNKILLSVILFFVITVGIASMIMSGVRNKNVADRAAENEAAQALAESEMPAETEPEAPNEVASDDSAFIIPVDYKFSGDREGCCVELVPSADDPEIYDIRICSHSDGNQVIQQFLCGKITDKVETVQKGPNFIVYPEGNEKGKYGWLFTAEKEQLFYEEPIEFPVYDECRNFSLCPLGNFRVDESTETEQKYTLYRINEEKREVVATRSWIFNKEDQSLLIYDWLEKAELFNGKVQVKEDGDLISKEYFEFLFWNDHHNIYGEDSYDSSLEVWLEGDFGENAIDTEGNEGYEWAVNVRGHDGKTAEYADRQTFLEDFGFWGETPLYEVYDRFGNPELELYLDKKTGRGCGILYGHYFSKNLKKHIGMFGFTFDSTFETEWWNPDSYRIEVPDNVKDYEEVYEYNENGRPDSFVSTGFVEKDKNGNEVNEVQTLDSINWIYRDDGTLFWDDHDGKHFYDEEERLIYETQYITHGELEYYYIYEGSSRKPSYCLQLDDNLGYHIPVMIKFK